MNADECERPCGSIRCETYGCQRVGVPSPSVPVGGLPDGTRVRAVIEGTLYGSLLRTGYGWNLNIRDCVSLEPVPVVPEPGRWYLDALGRMWFGLPRERVSCWANNGWAATRPAIGLDARVLPLVECEPPAEFRDGQQ